MILVFAIMAWVAGMAASLVGVAFALSVGVVLLRGGELTIDYSGIGIRGGGFGAPPAIGMSEVRSAGVTTVSGYEHFGGFGYFRRRGGASGWITRSGEALVVHRHDKSDFVYTVDDADEAATVLNTLVARYQSRDQTLTA